MKQINITRNNTINQYNKYQHNNYDRDKFFTL